MIDWQKEIDERLEAARQRTGLGEAANAFMLESMQAKYSYNYEWLGRPIIQYPQDIVAMQEIVWTVKPDLIVETGIAHGGSLMLSASMLAMLDYAAAVESGQPLHPAQSQRRVIGIDIDIRAHNRAAIEAHPLAHLIDMIEGSSTASGIVSEVQAKASAFDRVLVCLDSNHTHDHVLAELEAYAPLVTCGSYCVVFDTVVDDAPAEFFPDRPWGPGNNPKTAVQKYLESHPEFEIDRKIEERLLISVAPGGYLRRAS